MNDLFANDPGTPHLGRPWVDGFRINDVSNGQCRENDRQNAGDLISLGGLMFRIPGTFFVFAVASKVHGIGDIADFAKGCHDQRNEQGNVVFKTLHQRRFFAQLDTAHHHTVPDIEKVIGDIRNGTIGQGDDRTDFIMQTALVQPGSKFRGGRRKRKCDDRGKGSCTLGPDDKLIPEPFFGNIQLSGSRSPQNMLNTDVVKTGIGAHKEKHDAADQGDRDKGEYKHKDDASPAIYLASERKPNALFVISSFTSIRAVADNLVGPLKYLLKDRLSSKDYIKKVTCPILFIHGQSDPLIPFKETILLKELCDCPFEVFLPEEMTHNDFDLEDDIVDPINKFIKRNCLVDIELNDFKKYENEINQLYNMPEDIESYIKKNSK